MRRLLIAVLAWLSCFLSPALYAQTAAPTSGLQLADIDPSVRPQDDLFRYANGHWLKTTPIPDDRASWGVSEMMTDRATEQLRGIVEKAETSTDPEARKVGDLYASFMDEATIERLGIAPLQPELARIDAVATPADLATLMAHMDRLGVTAPFGAAVQQDLKQSTQYVEYIGQGGLGLPERDFFLLNTPHFVDVRTKYKAHIAAMLSLSGDANAQREASDIFKLEMKLARIQRSAVALGDPAKNYHKNTLAEVRALIPGFDWTSYLKERGLEGRLTTIIIGQPEYMRALQNVFQTTSMETWRAYFRFHLLAAYAPNLAHAFVDEEFAFSGGVLSGVPKIQPRWKRGVTLVDATIGEASGKLYVAEYFSADTKARVEAMVKRILAAYAHSIDGLDWMSAAAKLEAHAKIDTMSTKIGYPNQWRDYSALTIRTDDLMGNVIRGALFASDFDLAKLGAPVNREEWDSTPPTVNAFYDPSKNQITLPAGVLQPPAYDPRADDAYNYGSTGSSVGHEISHAFDNSGSQFDSKGNLRDWMSKKDHRAFDAMTSILIKQYSGYEAAPGYHVNGALTLGENIADIAGIEIAHKAYLASLNGQASPLIDAYTPEQRFYLGYAQSWLGQQREAATIAQNQADPHAPNAFRANGSVVHMQSFYDAFDVQPGDQMYLPPHQRVTLW